MEEKTIFKWVFVWDYRKEEKWLNEMAMNGWVLIDVHLFVYKFRKCEPGEYEVCLVYPENGNDYREFVESTGAEYIGQVSRWQYYRSLSSNGPFRLNSDIDSQILQLKRIERTLLIVAAMNLWVGMIPHNSVNKLNLLCVAVLTYAIGRLRGERSVLESEREIHE